MMYEVGAPREGGQGWEEDMKPSKRVALDRAHEGGLSLILLGCNSPLRVGTEQESWPFILSRLSVIGQGPPGGT